MNFKVIEIIDGNKFKIRPDWVWIDQTGNLIKVFDYEAPDEKDEEYENFKKKLENLILGKEVELKYPIRISYGQLICSIYYNRDNLAKEFPEYSIESPDSSRRWEFFTQHNIK